MGRRSTNEIVIASGLRAANFVAPPVVPVVPTSGFTFVTVRADYDRADGLDPVGSVSFTPSAPMVNGATVVAAAVSRALNIDGVLNIDLAANTDPATAPTGTFYTVVEDINGASRTYTVIVPHNLGSPVSLATLGP